MFHGKPPQPGHAHPLADVQDEAGILRELTWADLVARLKASRGGRDASDSSEEAGDASFDATCARRIAAHHNGKSASNPDDLGNGKGPEGIANPAVHGAATGVART